MHHSLLTSFPVPGKKKRNGKRREKKQKLEVIPGSQGVALPSPLGKDRAGLDPFHCYAEPPAETHEEWVYGGGGAQGLSGSSGPCFPVCVERYVVSFMVFYRWGFGMPPHQYAFLH
jgi:hypothetical protein